jgi:DNA-binding SARP family transcriptional activator
LDVVADEPWLLYWRAMSRMYANPSAARSEFERAYDRFERNDDAVGLYLTFAAAVDCFRVDWNELTQVDSWITKFERLRLRHPLFPSSEVEVRAVFAIVAALANRHLSHPALPPWLERAEAIIRSQRNAVEAASLELQRFHYLLWNGWRAPTEAALERIEVIARDPTAPPQARVLRCLNLAYWNWMFGDLNAVFTHVAEGLEIAQSFGLTHWRAELLGNVVYASSLRGDLRTAHEYLQQMRTVETEGRLTVPHYHALLAVLELQQGDDLETAWQHALPGLRASEAGGHQYGLGLSLAFLANIALAQGKLAIAEEYTNAALSIASESNSDVHRLTCGMTQATLLLARGQVNAAGELLAQTLALSKQMGGMAQPFMSRATLADAYALALQHGIEVPHVNSQIRKFDLPAPPAARISGCWPFPVKIRTLGRFEILIDDAPLTFPTKAQKKPLELLKALIAYGGSQVREETLAGALWPESESDAAAAALKAAVHRVRKLIGEAAIERHQGRLTLNLQVCWVDVVAFEQSLSDVEQACSRRDIEKIHVGSERMLAAYPGGFLVTEHDVPWALAMRERLRARLLRHLEMSARLLASAGKHEQAIACYQRGLEVDPLAEGLYRGLMRVYFTTEHRADALRIYRRCQSVLQAELSLQPSPETLRLARSMGFA